LLSNPFLPTPPCRFGTAMACTYALVGGRVGTGEVCLVRVQSDFPAPAVHREQQRPDRPGPRPPCLSQAVHAEGGSGASSGTPRDNHSRFRAPNIRRKRMPALLRAHPHRKLAHAALEVACFWGFTPDFQSCAHPSERPSDRVRPRLHTHAIILQFYSCVRICDIHQIGRACTATLCVGCEKVDSHRL
jgi:hypothetical protein